MRETTRRKRRGFGHRPLTPAERQFSHAVRQAEGIDEEIAMLRVRLRNHLGAHPDDTEALASGLTTLARTIAIRYRISPVSGEDLAENMAAVLRSIGDQIMPLD